MNRIVLTGASSGLGAALAAELAAPGVRLLLIGRDAPRLAETAAAVTAKGGEAQTAAIDVADEDAMRAALLAFDAETPIDLIVANAGISLGRDPATGAQRPGDARRMVETNLMGALHTIEPLIPLMRARGHGRIAVIASIAARRPSADIPVYSAAKAALVAYGEALRSGLRGAGVSVTVICPGFVKTPMADRHHGPKLFEIPAPRAARIIARALRRRRARLTFPWPWAVLLWLDQLLPAALSDWFERHAAAEVDGKP